MVFVITLKYAPATPLIISKGIKITMVLNEEPIMAGRNNEWPFATTRF